ncbi:hypothetical protein ACFO8O_07415 [Hephaestia sp. GCM10023244]|uniref:hypothetical protein n=1 Tax=unclassified Hephaestia TaxID=2631281 RepID=UPI00207721AF|nr:hypothetical protein [Hephaestia sp. MAHUQ-44]MCM8730795.1 hypothetical protein [Hephaestia sp. MAHUQ-44]
MAFREKLAWTLLTTNAVGYAVYLYIVAGITTALGWDAPVRAIIPALIGMIVWETILAIVGASAAALSAPKESYAPADERDRAVARHAAARAYGLLSTGIGVTIVLVLIGMSLFKIVNLLLGLLVLAEILRYGGEAWHYRKGY